MVPRRRPTHSRNAILKSLLLFRARNRALRTNQVHYSPLYAVRSIRGYLPAQPFVGRTRTLPLLVSEVADSKVVLNTVEQHKTHQKEQKGTSKAQPYVSATQIIKKRQRTAARAQDTTSRNPRVAQHTGGNKK